MDAPYCRGAGRGRATTARTHSHAHTNAHLHTYIITHKITHNHTKSRTQLRTQSHTESQTQLRQRERTTEHEPYLTYGPPSPSRWASPRHRPRGRSYERPTQTSHPQTARHAKRKERTEAREARQSRRSHTRPSRPTHAPDERIWGNPASNCQKSESKPPPKEYTSCREMFIARLQPPTCTLRCVLQQCIHNATDCCRVRLPHE